MYVYVYVRVYEHVRDIRRYLLPWTSDSAHRDVREAAGACACHIARHTVCSPREYTLRACACVRERERERERPGSRCLSRSSLRDTRPQCPAITSISSVSRALTLGRPRARARAHPDPAVRVLALTHAQPLQRSDPLLASSKSDTAATGSVSGASRGRTDA